MQGQTRTDVVARALLSVGILLPYWRLLTFGVLYVTDDVFTSDIYNGELPGRVIVGNLLRRGQLPVWTNQLCSGIPLAGAPADPIGLAAFVLLPPAAALDLLVVILLLVAGHGAYGLARRFGTDRTGAFLAGIAFAGSGYIACQLKHLAIVSTVVWLPVGLLLLDRVFDPRPETPPSRRALSMVGFGFVFAIQALSGFPQSCYICGLAYGAFAVFRVVDGRARLGHLRSATLLAGVGIATLLGAAAGAVVLLPLSALGDVSDRLGPLGYEWATRLSYWPPNLLTFLAPYVYGDISDGSYRGPSIFWEDYGYVGIATVLLAFYGSVRERGRSVVLFVKVMTLVAYLLVLGPATPVFSLAYHTIPGISLFRFPTRFLVVVELGLAVLGAIGLTRLRSDVARLTTRSWVPQVIALAICAGTALDLFIHQPRQNPIVSADEWLAAPGSAKAILADSPQPRTFTPAHMEQHAATFERARGWADLRPYFELRDILAPNTGGGFWDVPSADCYTALAPRWHADVWGDHNRVTSLALGLSKVDLKARTFQVDPALVTVLKTFGVSHLLGPYPQQGAPLTLVHHAGDAYVYRVEGARRVRFVRTARPVKTEQEAMERLQSPDFDPERELLLHDAETAALSPSHWTSDAVEGRARIVREDSTHVIIEAEAPDDGFLLLADTFYPGWTALVDGTPTPIYRANISVRGITLPKGEHTVTFTFDPPGFSRGLQITGTAITLLSLWAVGALYMDRKRRYFQSPSPPQQPITT